MTNKLSGTEIEVVSSVITAESQKAVTALRSGKVPREAIKTHPGNAGKIFSYVSHIHGTKTMNDAFNQSWDWEVKSWELFEDSSAIVLGSITMHHILRWVQFLCQGHG